MLTVNRQAYSFPLPGVVLVTSSPITLNTTDGPDPAPCFDPAPPLGLYRIKKYLEDRGLASCLVLDPNVDTGCKNKVLEFARGRLTPVVGVSLMRANLRSDLINVTVVREWIAALQATPLTLAGGYETTLDPDLVLSFGYVEGAVRGFGEFSLSAPVQALGRLDSREDLTAVTRQETPGIRWRNDTGSTGDPISRLRPMTRKISSASRPSLSRSCHGRSTGAGNSSYRFSDN